MTSAYCQKLNVVFIMRKINNNLCPSKSVKIHKTRMFSPSVLKMLKTLAKSLSQLKEADNIYSAKQSTQYIF